MKRNCLTLAVKYFKNRFWHTQPTVLSQIFKFKLIEILIIPKVKKKNIFKRKLKKPLETLFFQLRFHLTLFSIGLSTAAEHEKFLKNLRATVEKIQKNTKKTGFFFESVDTFQYMMFTKIQVIGTIQIQVSNFSWFRPSVLEISRLQSQSGRKTNFFWTLEMYRSGEISLN